VIAPATGLCSGCGRTLDEIARWGSISDADLSRIMLLLPERLARTSPAKPPQ